jgi:hypothetical protein
MWDQLRPADIERAKQKLAELRGITLKKHEEELKQLDADEADIETVARLAETITAKYLDGEPHSEQRTASADEPKDVGGAEIQPKSIPAPSLRNSSFSIATPLLRRMRG